MDPHQDNAQPSQSPQSAAEPQTVPPNQPVQEPAPWLQSFTTPQAAQPEQTAEASTNTVSSPEAETMPHEEEQVPKDYGAPIPSSPPPVSDPSPVTPPTPMERAPNESSVPEHVYHPASVHTKKSKAPLLIVIVLIVIVGTMTAAIAFHKKSPTKTAGSTKTTETIAIPRTPNAVAPTITATPQELATEFIKANQNGNKNLADNLMSSKMKAGLKEATKSESFYDYCKNDQFCDSLKWVTLSSADITVSDDKLPDGSAVKVVKYDVTTNTNNAKSINTVRISVSGSGTSWLVEDLEQSFSGASK